MAVGVPDFVDSIDHEIGVYRARDGYELHYRRFRPPEDAAPKGCVIVLHGIQSHSAWYVGSASWLARAGYDVAALDRRGSGMNARARGDAPDAEALVADVDSARSEVFGAGAVAVVGVSWGGKLAACYAARYPSRLWALVLSAPGLAAKVGYGARRMARLASASVIRPERLFPVPIEGAELFTANPEAQDYIRGDRLGLRWITARMARVSKALDRTLKRKVEEVRTPAFLMLAERDEIISNEKAQRMFARFGSATKRTKLYKGATHTLDFEPDPTDPFRDMTAFLDDFADGAEDRGKHE
jgi:alpha-beta hydrolase superfamily lysophospholipase